MSYHNVLVTVRVAMLELANIVVCYEKRVFLREQPTKEVLHRSFSGGCTITANYKRYCFVETGGSVAGIADVVEGIPYGNGGFTMD